MATLEPKLLTDYKPAVSSIAGKEDEYLLVAVLDDGTAADEATKLVKASALMGGSNVKITEAWTYSGGQNSATIEKCAVGDILLIGFASYGLSPMTYVVPLSGTTTTISVWIENEGVVTHATLVTTIGEADTFVNDETVVGDLVSIHRIQIL